MVCLKKKLFFAAVMISSVFSFSAFAQENTDLNQNSQNQENETLVLTIEDAVARALDTHINIKRAEITRDQAKREYSHSWNNFLPSISATGNGVLSKTITNNDVNMFSAGTGISANLGLNLGLGPGLSLLKSQYEAGELSYEDAVRSTETLVRQNFYSLLYLYQNYETSKITLDSYQRQYEQTQQKYVRGVASELELLTAQVNYETAKPDVDSALATFNAQIHSFLDTIGIEPGVRVELSGTLDDAEKIGEISYSILEDCVEQSADVKLLEKNLEIARKSRNAAFLSTLFPSLNLGFSVTPWEYGYNLNTSTGNTSTPDWNVSLGLSIPIDNLIPGSSARDNLASMDDTIRDYELQLENLKKTTRTSVAQKLDDIMLSKKNLSARKLNVELAQKSYTMTEEAYQRGTKDLLTLESALDTLRSAELRLRQEQYNLLSNVLELENQLSLPAGTYMTKE